VLKPTCKLWLVCNKKPQVTDDSRAFWARVRLVPFTESFVGREDRLRRPALTNDPRHQRAVLAWIVRGAMRYHAEGLPALPGAVRDATL
jgi:phage/plasmid-associated DNA primase